MECFKQVTGINYRNICVEYDWRTQSQSYTVVDKLQSKEVVIGVVIPSDCKSTKELKKLENNQSLKEELENCGGPRSQLCQWSSQHLVLILKLEE